MPPMTTPNANEADKSIKGGLIMMILMGWDFVKVTYSNMS